MKVLHVTGARPNFPKMAPVEYALRRAAVDQVVVHTGQHFDRNLSELFFEQLGIRRPDVNLGVGSGTHAAQTSAIMRMIEPVLIAERPDVVVVYGDVNSTVAAALVAVKLGLPVAHVEAGLRSFDRSMPEEINRVVVDSIADILYTTCSDASENLEREGVEAERIHFVGNPMIDSLMLHRPRFQSQTPTWLHAIDEPFALVTMHRPGNVDQPEDASEIASVLRDISARMPVIFPIHPRSRQNLERYGILDLPTVYIVDPMGYLEFMATMERARVVVTDSGGIQEETTMLGVACLTVRPNTERPVTITEGTNRLVERTAVGAAIDRELASPKAAAGPPELWDGAAGARIAASLTEVLS